MSERPSPAELRYAASSLEGAARNLHAKAEGQPDARDKVLIRTAADTLVRVALWLEAVSGEKGDV